MFACPLDNCGGKSANYQGVVAHLRMVHKLDESQRAAVITPEWRAAQPVTTTAASVAAPNATAAPATVLKPVRVNLPAAKLDALVAKMDRWLATEAPNA